MSTTPRLLPFILTLALLGGADPLQPQAPANGNRLMAEFPIELVGNKTILQVQIGSATRRMILDTGMDYDGLVVFDTAGIDRRGLNLAVAQIGGAGSGEPSVALFDPAGSFQLGTLTLRQQRLVFLTSGTFKGFPNEGVIGYSLLGHYAVEIDYDAGRMRLYEPQSFRADVSWTPVDIYFTDRRIPFMKVRTQTALEPAVELATYIDFASREALELLDTTTNRWTRPVTNEERVIGRGLSGDITGSYGRMASVWVGPHQLRNVEVAVTAKGPRSKVNGEVDAVVANNLLRRFNLVFDYAHSKLYVKPNRSFAEPF